MHKLKGLLFLSKNKWYELCFLLGVDVASVSNGCARTTVGTGSTENPIIPQLSWIQTPSVLEIEEGKKIAY